MRYQNPKFLKVSVSDTIKCKPDIYDRELTDCEVLKIDSTQLRNGYDRMEIFVNVIDRKNYQTWIFDEKDTDL